MSILTRVFDRLSFAAADIVRSSWFLQFLRNGIDNFRAGGIRQLSQFVKGILQIPFRDAFLFEANQKRTLLRFLPTRFNHPCARTSAARVAESISQLPCD